MSFNGPDNLDYLFEDEDPHAIIEVPRREQDESESGEAEESDSDDDLSEAFEDAGGFGALQGDDSEEDLLSKAIEDAGGLENNSDQNSEEDELTKAINDVGGFEVDSDDNEEGGNHKDLGDEGQSQQIDPQSAARVVPPSPIIAPAPAPLPPALTATITGTPTRADVDEDVDENEDDCNQEFEDIPLFAPMPAAQGTAPPDAPADRGRGHRLTKRPRTVNLNGLPIRLDADGIEIGYREVPPSEKTYAWASDEPVAEDDAYFAKGCQRRMVFVSDPVPVQHQYEAHNRDFVKKTAEVDYRSAVDKAYEWNRTRRGVTGATDETLKDGKIPRHFVLKMGPPNGPYGDALRVAERLKALIEHFFFTRLATSHLTIEIAIPFHNLGGQSYYEKYMEKIRWVMEHKRIRDRLTVYLDSESAKQYLDCDPKQFYPPNVDYDALWLEKLKEPELLWTYVYQGRADAMPPGWVPSWEHIPEAKQRWLHMMKLTEADHKGHVDQAISKVREFVQFVRNYEAWKRDGSVPIARPEPVIDPLPAPSRQHRLFMAESTAVPTQHNTRGYLQTSPSQRAAETLPTPYPPNALAPFSVPAPQPMAPFPHTSGQAPLPPPRPLGPFRQPCHAPPQSYGAPAHPYKAPNEPYGAPSDRYCSVMSFGSTPAQQDRNMYQMMERETREYHNRMQQANAREWQRLRQQRQEHPAAPVSAHAAGVARQSSSGSIAQPGTTDVGSPTASSLGKRNCGENEDEHLEKRSRQ